MKINEKKIKEIIDHYYSYRKKYNEIKRYNEKYDPDNDIKSAWESPRDMLMMEIKELITNISKEESQIEKLKPSVLEWIFNFARRHHEVDYIMPIDDEYVLSINHKEYRVTGKNDREIMDNITITFDKFSTVEN